LDYQIFLKIQFKIQILKSNKMQIIVKTQTIPKIQIHKAMLTQIKTMNFSPYLLD